MTAINNLQDIIEAEKTPFEKRVNGVTAYQLLQSITEEKPHLPALTILDPDTLIDNETDISLQQLLENVNRTANMLLSRGVKADESVTHCLPLVAEGFYIKIASETVAIANPVNPMLEAEHILGITEAANTTVLVIPGKAFSEEFFNKGIEVYKNNPKIHTVYVLGGQNECDGDAILPLEPEIARHCGNKINGKLSDSFEDVAAYFHTGGTTGVPKLAIHTQRMRVAQTISTQLMLNYSEQQTLALGLPLFHTAGSLISGLYALLSGCRVILLSPEGFRDRHMTSNFWKIVEKYKVSILLSVPTVLSGLLNVPIKDADTSSLKTVLTGGAPVPIEIIRAMSEALNIEISQGFGMTEMGGMCTIQVSPTPESRGSAGIRQPYIDMKIGQEQADGSISGQAAPNEIGILCYRGPCAMPGYAGGKAQAETFSDDGWLITGDLARIDDNNELWITGRAKDLIIRGGHNIDAMVIEDALHRHPAVELAAAIGKPDEYTGELPIAYVQLKPGASVSIEELTEFGKQEISERAAIPAEIILIDSMPKTGVDKIFKPALRFDAIKRTYEARIDQLNDAQIIAHVEVANDPSLGTLAKVILSGSKDQDIESRIASALNSFPTQHSIEWANEVIA
jgi:fatty-acyl-CoA synthase